MGKTALALMFGQMYRDFFSAGVYHVHASPVESLDRTVDANVSHPSNPYLLVLDEIEARPVDDLQVEIQELRRVRPSARLICISRRQVSIPAFDSTIRLSGLSQSEFMELLAKAGTFAQSAESQGELFEALSGNVLATHIVADLLQTQRLSTREILLRLQGFSQSGIVDAHGNPMASDAPEAQRIIVDITSVSDQLLERVHANPEVMYKLPSRRFEEFVADVLDRLGYSITLTPPSKDGGKDIYAAKKDHLGSFLYVVECKRYAPENRVGVGLIRQLSGVVQAEQATAGIFITTSFFTKDAQKFQERIPHQMSLKDFFGIQEWLQEVFRR
ncbi:restriction endonuclease [Paraburkholderia aspalathi]|uniref:Restriction system protein n=1 Tax=Paraburkholderia aspalathi TaxID=1324617 RepID=A0A1I7AB31_9BURK|nr:restriction endonuclease [Paraburkholderia aspalathi]SFT72153.1 restriction system protein [Paraburkholderia aspalathi]